MIHLATVGAPAVARLVGRQAIPGENFLFLGRGDIADYFGVAGLADPYGIRCQYIAGVGSGLGMSAAIAEPAGSMKHNDSSVSAALMVVPLACRLTPHSIAQPACS